ncbi:siderophore-iron reductase FhuF [uncultured Variovorax sp.]|uniref:siderophore-iron reductase FhuF n=1 Tax=uncultured Variovorax sp. TaxID=114708 RepID=UPI0025E02A95|nr:siderophore-iron reductase FhuF [uncultured Variovorax sp.]
MIPLLAPIFRGEWAAYGETLACAPQPPAGAVRVAELISRPELLASLLQRHARHRRVRGSDLRPAASAWSMHYLDALLPPVAAAASLLQHEFPVAPAQVWISFDDDDSAVPRRFHITHEGHARPGTDAAVRYAALLFEHLAPLFAQLARLTRIAPKILWGNTARYLQPVLEQGLLLSGHAPSVAKDLDHLLHQPRWGCADNPMFTMQRKVVRMQSGTPASVTLHRQCCLYYLLPDEGYCGVCPLAPEFRKARAPA